MRKMGLGICVVVLLVAASLVGSVEAGLHHRAVGCDPCAVPCCPPPVRVRGHFEPATEMIDVCRVVRRPVVETVERDVTRTVCKPVYETVTREVPYTAWQPQTFTRTVMVDRGHWDVQRFEVPGPVVCRRVWVPCPVVACDPCARSVCHHGHFKMVPVQCPPRVHCRRVWVPNVVPQEVTCTRMVPSVQTRTCTYQVCRMVPEVVTQRVQQTFCRMVCDRVVVTVPRCRLVWVPAQFIPQCCAVCGSGASTPPMPPHHAPEAGMHPMPPHHMPMPGGGMPGMPPHNAPMSGSGGFGVGSGRMAMPAPPVPHADMMMPMVAEPEPTVLP